MPKLTEAFGGATVQRQDLVKAVRDAAALGASPMSQSAYRKPAYELVLSEPLAYESDT